ncbi:MAG TPA: ADP-forming succinate--CoA ligase subunit beta [Nitrospina sp.]|jgi:succinyl-CoA synthetase beta subunit|nr:ADP-forming succinate--CoA ligase subunit beta [Nitrospinota bacterium]MDP6335361.1 ADP-forming succinate--CoA ligase subunit beta [Nitrospinaceae bacterium]MDP7147612.1 ADP-forming succinate--CoA ligase subunit beta [Nitrospinaceae bacterium]MDP7611530.1 ADP-forming succinate--CoA ligase subunit beta [Nitrospinaceae bacterium]HAX47142.1 ADP-forming succinate--CoA ligase subunit beta [Nitrospina sp.]|tara:strand:+ start:1123 stop:2283 length:1161 start_codon:yes stop_codon:yes gene_type:complete
MKIHEHQAKDILAKHGVPVPQGIVADTPGKAEAAARKLGTDIVVVKAQIHAGGRGKGGGVKLAKSPADAKKLASKIIGMTLVTPQTGPEGRKVKKVLVEEGMPIAKELYMGILLDRQTSRVMIMASEAGGMEIEEVAAETPERIIKEQVDPITGVKPYLARKIAFALNLKGDALKKMIPFIMNLYQAFIKEDFDMLEINPLIITKDDRVLALDAKVTIDSNALHRQKETLAYRDLDEEDPMEVEASKSNLNYIKLEGNIGCMVNGAGLAMATMDIIKHSGGEPANFLDVGGGADEETIGNGFRILLSDSNVKGIFINIFGGILRCDILARGVVGAAKKLDIKIPIVVRMEGTNMEEGHKILGESGIDVIVAEGMKDGAQKMVKAVK